MSTHFQCTSAGTPRRLEISFASDPAGQLGAQLNTCDKGQMSEMFCPGYAAIGRLIEGDTVARKAGVAVGDFIVAVNDVGFRRFAPDDKEEGVADTDADVSAEEAALRRKIKSKVVPTGQPGEAYGALLGSIKSIKGAADPANPLALSLERHGWNARANSWPRFLVARDGDVPAAMQMLQTHEEWKEKTFPINTSDPLIKMVMASRAVSEVSGRGGGHPTLCVNFSALQRLEDADGSHVADAFVMLVETALARAVVGGDPRTPRLCQLIDLTGVGISSKLRIDVLKTVYGRFEPNYPETLEKMVLYPVSRYLASTCNMLLSFVNEKTKNKFVITDSLPTVCKELGWDPAVVEAAGGVSEYIEASSIGEGGS